MQRWIPLALLVLLTGCATTQPETTPAAPGTTPSGTVGTTMPSEPGKTPFQVLAEVIKDLANNPIFQIALADSAATKNWIESAADAPTDPLLRAQAEICPTMVTLAVQDFQAKAQQWIDLLNSLDQQIQQGPPGPYFILLGTKLRYSTSAQADPKAQFAAIKQDVYNRVSAVVNGCRNILPTKQVNEVVKIAAKAGIVVGSGGAGAGVLPFLQ